MITCNCILERYQLSLCHDLTSDFTWRLEFEYNNQRIFTRLALMYVN